jgi:HisJ family histidinol phosphate phosphatase
MIKSDNHNHIIHDNIKSMIAAARTSGFASISITEHISQFSELRASVGFNSVHRNGRMFSNFEEYLMEFQKVNGKNPPKVMRGLEVDYIPFFEEQISNYVKMEKWDVILLSVHELERNGKDIEKQDQAHDKENSARRWQEYFELQMQPLESKLVPFHVLTHPVRLARGTPLVPKNIDQLLLHLATLAREKGKALELNGNDITRDYGLVVKLANACATANCEVSFGSDAHYADQVGRGYHKALELIENFNLRQRENFHE